MYRKMSRGKEASVSFTPTGDNGAVPEVSIAPKAVINANSAELSLG
jgi:hypothetical protein